MKGRKKERRLGVGQGHVFHETQRKGYEEVVPAHKITQTRTKKPTPMGGALKKKKCLGGSLGGVEAKPGPKHSPTREVTNASWGSSLGRISNTGEYTGFRGAA